MVADSRPQGKLQISPSAIAGILGLIFAALAAQALAGPLAALGIVLAAGMTLVFLNKPHAATLMAAFLLYSNLSVMTTTYGVPTTLAGGAVLILLALPLFHNTVIKHRRVVFTPIMALLAIYLAILVFSAALAKEPSRSFEPITIFVTEGLLLYFLTINAIRNKHVLRRVIWVLLLAGSLMGGVTTYQAITKSYDNEFGGFAQVTEAQVAVAEGENAPTVSIPAGPIGEKNRYAQVLGVLLPLAIMRLLAEKKPLLKLAALASFALILGGTLYTYSRGAGLAIVFMFLAMLPLGLVKLKHMLITGVIALLLALVVVPGFVYRLETLRDVPALLSGDPGEADSSLRGRATENLATWRIFLDHPVIGIGPGQAPSVMREYAKGVGFRLLDPNRRAHNLYLEELANTGVVGFTVFMIMVVATVLQLFKLARERAPDQPERYYMLIGLMLTIFVYMVTAIFLHLAYARYYWFVLGVAGAAIEIYREVPVERRQPLLVEEAA